IGVDNILFQIKLGVEALAKEHDECNLELHKQEIVKAVELCREAFDLVLPNIRHEIFYLEKFYGQPTQASKTILPEIAALQEKLASHQISLQSFLNGYMDGAAPVPGYRELRACNGVFSPFQFYDHSFETYRDINTCYYEICKSMEALVKEKRVEGAYEKFLKRLRASSKPIGKMGDIFAAGQFIDRFYQEAALKYSFTEGMRKVRPLLGHFHQFRKQLAAYDLDAVAAVEEELNRFFLDHPDKARYRVIMNRVRRGIETQTLPFSRIETVFSKLRDADFNIIVDDIGAKDLIIAITPHHEKKFGRSLLERINTVLQEIEYWYPPEKRKAYLQEMAEPLRCLQADEPMDRNEFFKRMQGFDQEIERNLRHCYGEKIREIQLISTNFQKNFSSKQARDRLASRLANQNIWAEILPRLQIVQKELDAIAHQNGSKKGNVYRFPNLKRASEELCQLVYDLAMLLFTYFPGAEDTYVASMTAILTTCNEFHDLPTLWAAFSHYPKKVGIPNFSVNEQIIMDTSKNPMCKVRFKELFSA
ncbi:MAG: hypothetical protein ACE5ER_12550, partial [Nitrospinaceae bacterium]